ncbi:CPBP family glutamic-type intramembrane protease [Anditalea andensis]|uniref:CPBP family glutamic-type intramembrane protease n=1 Tax=Anditalea andensis TaxID=1048983 RepID=UPI0013DE819A
MFHSSLFHLLIFALYIGGLALLLKFRTPPSRIIIVFLSAVIFALFHLANYNTLDVLINFYYIPLLILSQFVGALILSFIFWNYGLKYSILFHMTWDLIFILPKLLL